MTDGHTDPKIGPQVYLGPIKNVFFSGRFAGEKAKQIFISLPPFLTSLYSIYNKSDMMFQLKYSGMYVGGGGYSRHTSLERGQQVMCVILLGIS